MNCPVMGVELQDFLFLAVVGAQRKERSVLAGLKVPEGCPEGMPFQWTGNDPHLTLLGEGKQPLLP